MRNLFRKEPSYVSVPGQARAATEAQVGGGLWVRCDNERCRELLYVREFENNLKVCHKCQHHARLTALERVSQLVDDGSFVEHDAHLSSGDPLDFTAGETSYGRKLLDVAASTGLREAAIAGYASID